MSRRATRAARAAALLVGLALPACGEPATVRPLVGLALVDALRDGGHVVYLRHTSTDGGVEDAPDPLGDCDRQRPLDAAGRRDAAELGEAVRALAIPVGEVRASPYCRTRETAERAFGRAVLDEGLLPPTDGTRGRTAEALRGLLSAVPDGGDNTVLVGHLTNLRLLVRASPDEGGTVVLRPDGDGFLLVGQVRPQGWQRLAERAG